MKELRSGAKIYLAILFVTVISFLTVTNGECMGSHDKTFTVKIGVIIPLTGPISFVGQFIKEGVELAKNEVNAKNSENGFRLEILYSDNKGLPKDSVSIIQRNTHLDKVKFFLVSPTPACMAVAPIVDKMKVIMFVGSTHPYITDKSEYIFRTCASNAEENEFLIKYAATKGIRSVGALFVQDDFGQSAVKYFKDHFTGEVLIEEPYRMRDTAFRHQLLKIKQCDPEAVLIHGYGFAFPIILKQMLELGMDDRPILSDLGFTNPPVQNIIKILPQDFMKRITFSAPSFSQRFTDVIEKKYSKKPNLAQAYAYDFIKIISSEIKKNGFDIEKIKKSILQIKNYSGAFEKITFLPNGDSRSIIKLMKIENGEIVPLRQRD